ncbi:MAG: cupin domain-containing protein [Actinobacteria bacterium]|nr:cupin domain-containing protein [Actinomycetota bacterium]
MGAWMTPAEGRIGRDEIERALARYGTPQWWSNGADERYAPHSHPYHKVLFCVAGSIAFHVEGDNHLLSSGDRLDIEPGTEHAASVGPQGVQCGEVAVEE